VAKSAAFSRAPASIVAFQHQQLSGARPAAIAHWFSPPHSGHIDAGGGESVISLSSWLWARRYNTGLLAGWVMMGGDGDDLFSDAMSDVVPLKRERRVSIDRGPSSERDSSVARRRQAAAQVPEADRNHLTQGEVKPLDPWYVLSFKRPGVQNGVFRKLKQGRYEAQSRLDLHRMTTERARREIFEFVDECHQLGLRSVLVIHGKGEGGGNPAQGSILKGCVDVWLRDLPVVQAFHSAQLRHGGTGAVYVLLRKSEEKKAENREKFAKGRVPTEPL
jgi:DNA-nicking Smr family endonuclease